MITVHDLRGTMADTLQLLVQSEDELRKREALAGVGVDVHLGMMEAEGKGGRSALSDVWTLAQCRSNRHLRYRELPPSPTRVSAESINGLMVRFNLFDLLRARPSQCTDTRSTRSERRRLHDRRDRQRPWRRRQRGLVRRTKTRSRSRTTRRCPKSTLR